MSEEPERTTHIMVELCPICNKPMGKPGTLFNASKWNLLKRDGESCVVQAYCSEECMLEAQEPGDKIELRNPTGY